MTEQMVSAAAIREWRDKYQGCTANNALEALDALIPAPPRPTLADMTLDEQAECQWMQADVKSRDGQWVIANPFDDDEEVGLIDPTGDICWRSPDLVTPRPDLPRVTWPGGKKSAPAPEVMPGVVVGQPVTNPDVMLDISLYAPDGTVVVGRAPDCHPVASVKSDGPWQSVTGMRVNLYHTLGVRGYAELESVTVVRWGKEADQ